MSFRFRLMVCEEDLDCDEDEGTGGGMVVGGGMTTDVTRDFAAVKLVDTFGVVVIRGGSLLVVRLGCDEEDEETEGGGGMVEVTNDFAVVKAVDNDVVGGGLLVGAGGGGGFVAPVSGAAFVAPASGRAGAGTGPERAD